MIRQTVLGAEPSKWEFMLRFRYQIALGVLGAIVVPGILRNLLFGVPLDLPAQYITMIGAALALVLGYIGYRRLQIFPGIAAGGYIFTSFTIAYGILATSLILLRLDFTRAQFLVSYVMTVSIFTFIHLRFVARRKILLGVVPGGLIKKLPDTSQVDWFHITNANAPTPRLNGVVADLRADHSSAWNSRIAAFVLEGIPVYHVKQVVEQISGRVEVEHLSENTLGSLNPNDIYIKVKAAMDGAIALIMLILLLPLLAIVSVMIRIDSPGPALFKQQRVGFRARPFTVYKFRTMRVEQRSADAEDHDDRMSAMTKPNDPRITRLGSFLRRSRIDELPQLLNIVKGEMSLIGPRPEAVPLSKWYEVEIPFYHYRHIIKPGVTGWAQVNQGHVTDVDNVREKLHLDFYYVKNFSFWLDILIALRTIQTMITGRGAR